MSETYVDIGEEDPVADALADERPTEADLITALRALLNGRDDEVRRLALEVALLRRRLEEARALLVEQRDQIAGLRADLNAALEDPDEDPVPGEPVAVG